MPKVSVILTSYNHGAFVRQAIESVLSQSFDDFELIIWDDHSTDDSWNIISSYSDTRIKAFKNDVNLGSTFGVNKAIFEFASGEFIAIHHSDDVWLPGKLAKQTRFLNENPQFGATFGSIQLVDMSGNAHPSANHVYQTAFLQENRSRQLWLRRFWLHGNALCHPSVLIRRSCYVECGEYRGDLFQLPDFDMWVRLCSRYEINVDSEPLVQFRLLDNEVNTSGIRFDTIARTDVETLRVLESAITLLSPSDFQLAFPEFNPYRYQDEIDVAFWMGRALIQNSVDTPRKLFGVMLLYDLCSSPRSCQEIQIRHGFDLHELKKIGGEWELLHVPARWEHAQALWHSALAHRDQLLAENAAHLVKQRTDLSNALQRALALESSVSWRLTKPLRFLRGLF